MSGDGTDGSYAPKSPDLSSFYTPGSTPPAEPPESSHRLLSQQSRSKFAGVQPHSSPYFSNSFEQHAHAPPHLQNWQQLQQQVGRVATQPHTLAQARSLDYPNSSQSPGFEAGVGAGYLSTGVHSHYFPPRTPPSAAQPARGYTAPGLYSDNIAYQYHQHITAQAAQVRPQQEPYGYPTASTSPTAATGGGRGRGRGREATAQGSIHELPTAAMPPRRAAAAAAAAALQHQQNQEQQQDQEMTEHNQQQQQISATAAAAGPSSSSAPGGGGGGGSGMMIEPSPVKTKFPTARIKRIMQADEEVGKVAQQTPIAVGKALELFMVALVTKSAEVARQKNSKRVSAQMLKQVVESDDQWDFLRDIVGKIEGGGGEEKGSSRNSQAAAAGRVKAESESDEDAGGGVVKKKRGGGRKKKIKGE